MVHSIIQALAGIALLIYGIEKMSSSLKVMAGSRFKSIIEKTTNTPLKGILIGTLATAIIQSSTGVTVLTVGLVRAGLMTLPQSIGIIMGANIGTTFTVYFMALPIVEYGLAFVFIGVILSFFKKKRVKHIGGIILGLGLLFYGLELMDALKEIAKLPIAEQMFTTFSSNWFAGTLFGTVFTAIIQSSTAAMGILVKLYEMHGTVVNGQTLQTISLKGALPIILGLNIGTTLSSFVASIGGNTESKRTAMAHILFNIIGSLFFLILLSPYYMLMQWLQDSYFGSNRALTLAVAHTIQNVVTTLVLYFFINQFIKLVKIIVPDKKGEKERAEYIYDEVIINESPVLALDLVRKGIIQMSDIVKEYFDLVKSYSFKDNVKAVEESETLELMIDNFDEKLHDYLIKIARKGLELKDSNRLSRNLDIIKDLERIGDHLNNIVLLFENRYELNQALSEEGFEDLTNLYNKLTEMMEKTFESYYNNNAILAKDVLKIEEEIDSLEELYRYKYIERLKDGSISFTSNVNYVDILSNLERIGDHLHNIAGVIIEPMHIPKNVIIAKNPVK